MFDPVFISSLTLRNILSFRDPPPLKLRSLNILIGANASGKSNLISCIQLLRALPNSLGSFIGQRGGTESWIWKGAKGRDDATGVTCQFKTEQEKLEYEITFSAVAHALVVLTEMLTQGEEPRLTPPFLNRDAGSLHIAGQRAPGPETPTIVRNESVLAVYRNPLDPTPITRSAQAFNDIRVYRGFRTGENDETRLGVSSSGPKHPIEETGYNLSLVLQEMDFQGSLKNVKEYLHRLSDRYEDIKIRPEGGRSTVYVQERGIKMIPAAGLSDGTLKFLCLMAVLLDPNPARLVCLEEPESGLHPDALTLVADALREASKRMQIVVTTHSDALIDRFGDRPESVVICDRDSSESTRFRRLSSKQLKEWLEDYTLGDLWRRGEIGGSQR
jgi:predicted ATPase